MTKQPVHRFYAFLYALLYNQLAPLYDMVSWCVSLGQWDRWRRSVLPFVCGRRVLEVGFGTGALLAALATSQREVVGLEASAGMQQVSRRRLAGCAETLPRTQGVVQALPFADASFDTVVTTFPAGFVLDPAAHREVARVLRVGGRLLVADVALHSQNPLLRLVFGLVFPAAPAAERRIHAAARRAGLSIRQHTVGRGRVRVVVTEAVKSRATSKPPAAQALAAYRSDDPDPMTPIR